MNRKKTMEDANMKFDVQTRDKLHALKIDNDNTLGKH
jgi:hypothetical protein